jgi:hypothetical protein
MKHFLILLFSIIVGECDKTKICWNSIMLLISYWVSVFSLYKSLSADETDRNDNEMDYVYSNVKALTRDKNELRVAQDKIKQLENRIAELEQRMPKKFEAVKFLNYQNRKRILITVDEGRSRSCSRR